MSASVFDDKWIREQILQAWQESNAGTEQAHEEGGFVLRDPDGSLSVERWPKGAQNEIFVPSHPGGKRQDRLIVATFHTHPNPGPGFHQEPSRTDIRAVRDDADLDHATYEGEFVVSTEYTYQIRRSGEVEIIGITDVVLKTV